MGEWGAGKTHVESISLVILSLCYQKATDSFDLPFNEKMRCH